MYLVSQEDHPIMSTPSGQPSIYGKGETENLHDIAPFPGEFLVVEISSSATVHVFIRLFKETLTTVPYGVYAGRPSFFPLRERNSAKKSFSFAASTHEVSV